jgi:nucleotide-binding universal stress UspA family protein
MKKILFPTDLSEAANRAFIYALHIADKLGANIITMHAYQKPELRAGGLPHTLQEFYKNYDLEEFRNYKDAIPTLREIQSNHHFNHIKVDHLLRRGAKIVPIILKEASEEKVDLIVMGTTGARGLKEIFLGSVAGEVLESANCPVLAVPESAEFDGQIDHIAMTISYAEEEKQAIEKVIDIFEPFQPLIKCVNVDLAHTGDYTHRMEHFATSFNRHQNLSFEVLDGNDFQEVLTSFLDNNDIDLLAMVTHKRNFLEELFSYSRTKAMAYHSSTPILSIPAHTLA